MIGIGIHDTRYQRYSALDDDGICLVGERLNDQSIIINREVPIESPDVVYSSARESHAQCCCLVPALHINITVRESKWRMADVHNSRIARKIQVPVVLAWNLSTV